MAQCKIATTRIRTLVEKTQQKADFKNRELDRVTYIKEHNQETVRQEVSVVDSLFICLFIYLFSYLFIN